MKSTETKRMKNGLNSSKFRTKTAKILQMAELLLRRPNENPPLNRYQNKE